MSERLETDGRGREAAGDRNKERRDAEAMICSRRCTLWSKPSTGPIRTSDRLKQGRYASRVMKWKDRRCRMLITTAEPDLSEMYVVHRFSCRAGLMLSRVARCRYVAYRSNLDMSFSTYTEIRPSNGPGNLPNVFGVTLRTRHRTACQVLVPLHETKSPAR